MKQGNKEIKKRHEPVKAQIQKVNQQYKLRASRTSLILILG